MKKILIVFGTRPEAIKTAPLILKLQKEKDMDIKICVSGQHREMLSSVLSLFNIIPDFDLAVMKKEQTLSYLTSTICEGVNKVLDTYHPDLVMVHGDTTTALASSLAAFYKSIPIAHIEAGLRSRDIRSPFPEEFNRRSISLMADIHFAPTEEAKQNLLSEGIEDGSIFVTGNTVIDALKLTESLPSSLALPDTDFLLMTVHRREHSECDILSIFRAVRRICHEFPTLRVLYPVHKSPRLLRLSAQIFDDIPNIFLSPPLPLNDFHHALRACRFVLTDSGGIQEEAAYLGKPVLVTRENTERPEGTESGNLKLIGSSETSVYENIRYLLCDKNSYGSAAVQCLAFGDGHASERITDILKKL